MFLFIVHLQTDPMFNNNNNNNNNNNDKFGIYTDLGLITLKK